MITPQIWSDSKTESSDTRTVVLKTRAHVQISTVLSVWLLGCIQHCFPHQICRQTHQLMSLYDTSKTVKEIYLVAMLRLSTANFIKLWVSWPWSCDQHNYGHHRCKNFYILKISSLKTCLLTFFLMLQTFFFIFRATKIYTICLLYTSDAADE